MRRVALSGKPRWRVFESTSQLVLAAVVQSGKATLADLTAGGATQLSLAPASGLGGCTGPGYPSNFPDTGNWTPVLGSSPPSPGVYAVSLQGVYPAACITWFQANQACLLSGKRLLTNREWQGAAAGTPDGSPCAVSSGHPGLEGGLCISSWGVEEMVGNVAEWVADWGDVATGCTFWSGTFGSDYSCVGGDGSSHLPGALFRGGGWSDGTDAGVFAVFGFSPLFAVADVGFRCAR